MSVSPERRAMLAKVHLAKKDLALDEASYRARLKRVTGKESAKHCTEAELHEVLREFERLGWTPRRRRAARGRESAAMRPMVAKIRALNRALWNLGALADPSEAALAAFVRRQAKVDDPAFLTPAGANLVIEALKARCARAGFEAPAGGAEPGLEAKRALVRAQWARLAALGAVRIAGEAALERWLQWRVAPGRTSLALLSAAQLDAAAEGLGGWIRRETKP
ncbi:MAG: phage protein GemA/Gp16 family protein [Kiloniellaceae bacterium]